MSVMYRVQFTIKKPALGAAGTADQYRGATRSAVVLAASAHPHDLLIPLANNYTLASGEVFEILSVQQVVVGTEGSAIMQ